MVSNRKFGEQHTKIKFDVVIPRKWTGNGLYKYRWSVSIPTTFPMVQPMVIDDEINVGIRNIRSVPCLYMTAINVQLEISDLDPTIWMTEDDGNANENQLRVNGGKSNQQQMMSILRSN